PGSDRRPPPCPTRRSSDRPLARDFVHRFLEPAGKLIGDYARLARRNVPSAQEMLREIERVDFPQLTARATAMFDRVHRGTIIDLDRKSTRLNSSHVKTSYA